MSLPVWLPEWLSLWSLRLSDNDHEHYYDNCIANNYNYNDHNYYNDYDNYNHHCCLTKNRSTSFEYYQQGKCSYYNECIWPRG